MKQSLTEIICILDRSGSMGSIIDDAIGGINTLLSDQRKYPGTRKVSIVLFDDHYEIPYNGVYAENVPDFTKDTYVPRGMTAMNDAIGKTIDDVGIRLAKTDESDRPEKVIFAILTDGQENSSHEYTAQQIKEKVTHQTDKYSWKFLFLAAGQDAVVTGTNLGISLGNSMNYSGSGKGTVRAYAMFASAVNNLASMTMDSYQSRTDDVMIKQNAGSNTLEDEK